MDTFVSLSPLTGKIMATFPTASGADADCAVEQARELAEEWRGRSVRERCAVLRRWRERLAADAEGLAATVTAEIGKPLQEAWGADVLPSLTALRWLEREAERLLRPRSASGAGLTAEPYGVVGVIGTWNYPLLLNLTPVAWALAAGNAVVLKPSELATVSALRLMDHAKETGLPVVTLPGGPETGRALCRAGVDKLAFTGGARTGRAILTELATTNTPSVMELSGNDAFLVCADADTKMAARCAVWARVCNAGQSCIAPQRFYVVREVYDAFLLECRRQIDQLRPGIDFGPMRTEQLRRNVYGLVRQAIAEGAELRIGGDCLTELPGFHYAPTLLAGCTDEMAVMAQDFFGPVLAVCPVASVEEGIALTNSSDMALGASVWTRNAALAKKVSDRLRVGLVAINQDSLLLGANPALPFGGSRGSGFGRQRGAAGLEEFIQWKVSAEHCGGAERRHLFPYRPATLPILRGLCAFQNAPSLRDKAQALQQLVRAASDWKRQSGQD